MLNDWTSSNTEFNLPPSSFLISNSTFPTLASIQSPWSLSFPHSVPAFPIHHSTFRILHSLWVWRRGWAFEVALRCFARAPAKGPSPLAPSLCFGHPMKRAHPLHNPRSNPTLLPAFPIHHSTFRILHSLWVWRRGWDSNPRSRCRDACFPSTSIRPLSHLSAEARRKESHLITRPHERQGKE